MPRLSSQNKELKDERRLSILNASLNLFALYGKNSITVNKVCDEAKISHGLFYHYYKDVDDLYENLLKTDEYKSLKYVVLELDERLSSFERIDKIITNLLKILKNESKQLSFLLLIFDEEGKDSFSNNIEKLIKNGQIEGDITGGNPIDIVTSMIYIFKGYIYQVLLSKKKDVKPLDKDIILELFRRRSRT